MPTTTPPSPNPAQVENTTDASRGEPIIVRALARKAELEEALQVLPIGEQRARTDIELALAALGEHLSGDLEHVPHTTAAEVSRWLEATKHLAERTPHEEPSEPTPEDLEEN